MTVAVRLLGSPSIRVGGEWGDAPLDKRMALLIYLACSDTWVSRERLSYLFWPDTRTSKARINLRQLLARTKTLPFAAGLEADDKRLRWAVGADVVDFRRAINERDWSTAAGLYRGELAAGLQLEDSGEFTNWLDFERSQLREAHRQAASEEAATAIAVGRPEKAAEYYDRLLAQDPLDEDVIQSLLRLLVQLGAVEEANRRLQSFAKRLQQELGFAPSAATELILTGADSQRAAVGASAVRSVANARDRRERLTAPLTSFVGRGLELSDTVARLSSESCRLLTILGPGGVGKTRLGLQAAQLLEHKFTHGLVALSLAAVPNVEGFLVALAAALNIELRWQRAPIEQLVDFLGSRELLLVLDSFEHLSDAALMVQHLLDDCRGLKVLVTSRERLKLQSEWLLPLSGLAAPPVAEGTIHTDNLQQALTYDAMVLLVERARQVEPGFIVTSTSLPAAIEICRLLDGLPLGIELAAGWLRTHSLEQVRTALASSLDELESDSTDAVDRHRTLRAAIDRSWELLTPEQQVALSSLGVFIDGWDRTAALGVAGVSLPLLQALIEKSLLRSNDIGRFDAHLLIQRYSQERLSADPDEQMRLSEAHADYFVRLLSSWSARLHGPEQPAMLAQLAPDYANITAAWLTALDRGWDSRCLAAIEPLVLFHGIQGRFSEGERLFAASLEHFEPYSTASDQGRELYAALKANLGWFLAGMARFDEARTHALDARGVAAERRFHAVEIRALSVLGSIASRRGDAAEARDLIERGVRLGEATGDQWMTGLLVGQLGLLALRAADHIAAKVHFERALSMSEALGNTPGVVNSLDYLGRLSLATNDEEAAAAAFERALDLAQRSRFRLRLPYLKTQLATVKLAAGQAVAAAELAREALAVAEELGQRALQVEALVLLGRAVQDVDEKSRWFTLALDLSHALDEIPRTLEVLVHLAQLPAPGAHPRLLLRLVAGHPAAGPAQRETALALLGELGASETVEDGALPTLEDAVRMLLP